MAPSTSERVESATSERANKKIYEQTIERLAKIIDTPTNQRSTLIDSRLNELNNEWDTERLLEFNASTLLMITMLLGYFHCSYWLLFAFAVAAFLWQHAVQGWCPPLPILRGLLGKRTSVEILSEKVALKILRGDYQPINPNDFAQGRNAKQLLHLADLHCINNKHN